jgi:hypothetical protein
MKVGQKKTIGINADFEILYKITAYIKINSFKISAKYTLY